MTSSICGKGKEPENIQMTQSKDDSSVYFFLQKMTPLGVQMAQLVRVQALDNKVAGSIPALDGGLHPLQLKTENSNWTWS